MSAAQAAAISRILSGAEIPRSSETFAKGECWQTEGFFAGLSDGEVKVEYIAATVEDNPEAVRETGLSRCEAALIVAGYPVERRQSLVTEPGAALMRECLFVGARA